MLELELDIEDMLRYLSPLETMQYEIPAVINKSVKDMASVYLSDVKRLTPKGERKEREEIKNGVKIIHRSESEGMKKGWKTSEPIKDGDKTTIKVFNSVSYAQYVNDGHRQNIGQYVPLLGRRLVKSWVEGLHITDKADAHLERVAPDLIFKNLNNLGEQ